MRHADLIGIGKKEANLSFGPRKILMNSIDLVVDVSTWLGNEGEEVFVQVSSFKGAESMECGTIIDVR